MKLYEIDNEIQKILDAMTVDEETGEVNLDMVALEELQQARADKLEGAALYVKDLEAMSKAIREEEKTLAQRRQAMEKKAVRLREWIAFNLGGEKLETARVKLSTRKGVSSAKVDDPNAVLSWFNENLLKDGWSTLNEEERKEYEHVSDLLDITFPPPAYSKAGIKKLFEEGYQIDGAHVETGLPSLQIK